MPVFDPGAAGHSHSDLSVRCRVVSVLPIDHVEIDPVVVCYGYHRLMLFLNHLDNPASGCQKLRRECTPDGLAIGVQIGNGRLTAAKHQIIANGTRDEEARAPRPLRFSLTTTGSSFPWPWKPRITSSPAVLGANPPPPPNIRARPPMPPIERSAPMCNCSRAWRARVVPTPWGRPPPAPGGAPFSFKSTKPGRRLVPDFAPISVSAQFSVTAT